MKVNVTDKERFSLDAGTINAAGFWHTGIRFARAGVQLYSAIDPVVAHTTAARENPSGMVRVLRDDSEVFSVESMASFEHVPITDNHKGGIVDSTTASAFTRGLSKAPVVKDEDSGLRVPVVIYDADMIRDAKAGLKAEASAGYSCDVEDAPGGVHDKYGEYDAVMRNIHGNHIALVPRGRAGREFTIEDKEDSMAVKRTYNGISVEFSEQGAEVFDSMSSEVEGKNKQIAELTEQLDGVTKERDEHKAALDTAAKPPSAAEIDALVKERKRVLDRARELMPEFSDERKAEDGTVELKSNDEVIKEVASHVVGKALDGHSDDYIKAVFDLAVKPSETPRVFDSVRPASSGIADTARAEFIKNRSGR